jgi:hypothetical protein
MRITKKTNLKKQIWDEFENQVYLQLVYLPFRGQFERKVFIQIWMSLYRRIKTQIWFNY